MSKLIQGRIVYLKVPRSDPQGHNPKNRGFAIISSAKEIADGEPYWQNHARFVGFGLLVFLAVSLMDYRWVRWIAIPLYVVSLILLALTLTKFGVLVSGATCWLKLPGLPAFQPSQIAITAGILLLSLFLSQFSGSLQS